MGEVKLYGGMLLAALFSIAIITFAISFAVDNDTAFNVDSSGAKYESAKNQVVGNLTIFHSDINKSSKSFADSEIQVGETFRTGGQFKGGMFSLFSTVLSYLGAAFSSIFGNGNGFGIFLTALGSFITFLMIRYAYKTWVGRNPD